MTPRATAGSASARSTASTTSPIRNNLTNFAGALTGSIREEQVYANDQWVTYRVRGGPQQADALFAPTTRTPWTDDFQLSYETDLGQGRSVLVLYTKRRTRDIIEDYDMALYAMRPDGSTSYPGPVRHPESLFLGLDYFGYDVFPESNFVIATLAGGARDYQGVELTFRQRLRSNWQALAAYTYGWGAPSFLGHGLRENPMSQEVGDMARSRRVKRTASARPESAPTARRLGWGPWRPGNGGARAANGTWLCGCCAASRWTRSRVKSG